MDPGLLVVFHDRRHVGIRAIRDGICFCFKSILEVAVNEDRSVRGYIHCAANIIAQHFLVVRDLHATSAEHVWRPCHERIADALRNGQRLLKVGGHVALRPGDADSLHHLAESVPVFRKIDRINTGTEDSNTRLVEFTRTIL